VAEDEGIDLVQRSADGKSLHYCQVKWAPRPLSEQPGPDDDIVRWLQRAMAPQGYEGLRRQVERFFAENPSADFRFVTNSRSGGVAWWSLRVTGAVLRATPKLTTAGVAVPLPSELVVPVDKEATRAFSRRVGYYFGLVLIATSAAYLLTVPQKEAVAGLIWPVTIIYGSLCLALALAALNK